MEKEDIKTIYRKVGTNLIIIGIVLVIFLIIFFIINFNKLKIIFPILYENDGYGELCLNNCRGYSGLVEGVDGKGFKFNNSYFIIFNQSSLDVLGSENLTIDLWYKLDKNTIGDLLFKGEANGSWFSLTQRNNRFNNEVWFQYSKNGGENNELKFTERVNNTWQQLRFTLVGFDVNSTNPLLLGSDCLVGYNITNKYECWTYWGAMDELKIYHNKELLVYLKFDELENNIFKDYSGNENDGVLIKLD